ncbi:MAG: hypothetical protein P8020_15440 [Acidobacteriota bacterium]
MIGAGLGLYEITARLGAGGMGEVYRATDTRLERETRGVGDTVSFSPF